MTTMRAAVAALAMTILIALGGCAADAGPPGTAALVDGKPISDAKLERFVDALAEGGRDPAKMRPLVLQALVFDRLNDRIVEKTGVSLSQADIDREAASQFADVQRDPRTRELAKALSRWDLLTSRLSQQQMVDALQDASVVVSPRYGMWNWEKFEVEPQVGSLSQLAPPRQ